MAEYIDKQAAIAELNKAYDSMSGLSPMFYSGYQNAVHRIKDFPAADVAPVRHGRWIRLNACKGMENFKCSACQSESYVPTCMYEPMSVYCPNCGGKMDGGKEND